MTVATSLVSVAPAIAGYADVLDVQVTRVSGNVYRVAVTLRHADEGWEHYADRWEIVGPGGEVLATRILRHPHVDEQPFTRSLPDVRIPVDARSFTVRAHDSLHGFGGKEKHIPLPR